VYSWSTYTFFFAAFVHNPVSCADICSGVTLPLLFAEAWSPRAIRINGWRYSGMLEADLVVRAVCSGFIHMHLGFSCSYGPEASSCAEERRELKHSTDFFDGQHSLHMFEPSRVLVLSFVFFCRIAGLLYPVIFLFPPHYSPLIEFSTLHSPLPSVPIFQDYSLAIEPKYSQSEKAQSSICTVFFCDVAQLPFLCSFWNPTPHSLFFHSRFPQILPQNAADAM